MIQFMLTVQENRGIKIFLIHAVLFIFTACSPHVNTAEKLETLTIVTGSGKRVNYRVEIADDDASRRKGLMHRQSLPQDQGMLFDFERSQYIAMWMKNTYIPLDMLFIDKDGFIVNIATDTEPHSTKQISSRGKVMAVLEINAHQVELHGIVVGDRVVHHLFE